MIYCHGWPSSRLEAGLAPVLPLRLVAFDRPGYGRSDPFPHASLQDLAADVGALATHLGIARFPVVGVSGGGPVACACARFLPGRVDALTLISPVPPAHRVRGGGLGWLMRLGRQPFVLRPALLAARALMHSHRAETMVFGRLMTGLDGDTMTSDRRHQLLMAMREGLRHGTAGARLDARLYGTDWGFRLEDVAVSTTVWHGTEDPLIPVETVHAYAGIPGVTVRIMPGEGHYSLAIGQTAMIMADLLDRAGSALH
jgi:pimeloyl-ACP methyl ester carboxylesterase